MEDKIEIQITQSKYIIFINIQTDFKINSKKLNGDFKNDNKSSSFIEDANRTLTARLSTLLEGSANMHIPGLDDDIMNMPFKHKGP